MLKIVFLFNNTPLPRIYKRIKIAKSLLSVTLIYWARGQKHDFRPQYQENEIQELPINVPAPVGKTLNRIFPLVSFGLKSLRELNKIKPSIIHAANFDMLLVASVYKLRRPSVCILYEVADLPKFKRLIWFEKLLKGMVDYLVLTSTHFYTEHYRELFNREHTLVIPNCPHKSTLKSFKKKPLGLGLTIGFIGSIRYYDQLVMLIDAAKAVGGIKILLAGTGPDYGRIAKYTADLEHVELYGPYDYHQEIADLYAKVDCLYSVYNASLFNVRVALPNRLYEAIVCELPLIVARGTELSKQVEEAKIGFSIDHQCIGELITLLSKLKSSPEILKSASDNCKKIKDQCYMENYENKLSDIYSQMASYSSQSRR